MRRMNRRTFIGTSIAATFAAAAKPAWAADTAHSAGRSAATRSIDRVGLQLYTVRESMKTDFEGTIAKVAATGYKEVEFAGYFDHSPKDVRAILDKNGLASPSCHVGYDIVDKNWPETLEAAKIVGHSFIICPWIDEKQRAAPDGWKRAAELFNKAGEASAKALPYDFLLAETHPKLVAMEMDLCWISVAGKDPLSYWEKYPGRFPLVHVKDWVKDASSPTEYQGAMGQSVKFGGRMADVGQGSINWTNLFAHSAKAGIKHYFVENDYPKSEFDDIKISYNYLHDLKY